jgi:hypothetical protein
LVRARNLCGYLHVSSAAPHPPRVHTEAMTMGPHLLKTTILRPTLTVPVLLAALVAVIELAKAGV